LSCFYYNIKINYMDKLNGGFTFKLFSGLISVLFIAGALFFDNIFLYGTGGIFILVFGMMIFFFRDPERIPPEGENVMVSPADGKIISVSQEYENTYLKENATRVSIYLNLFNVHVSRIPLSGTIEFLEYKKGSFYPAFLNKASERNERLAVGITHGNLKFLLILIAGTIARRIVYNVRTGDRVTTGDRFGFIKFGSRVELFVPERVKLNVSSGEKVKGALSIMSRLDEK